MPSTGARQDIAPYPEWTALWLYTGDWRMRQVALGLADQAASWAMHIRETDPTKRLLITDPKGASPASGYGLPFSHADRQSAFGQLTVGGNGLFNWGTAADNLKFGQRRIRTRTILGVGTARISRRRSSRNTS